MWHWLPNTEEIIATFKNWALVAVASTVGCFVVIYLGLPLVMTSERLSLSGGTKHIDISCTSLKFKLNSIATILRPGVSGWIVFVNISTIVAAGVMIALPFLQEVKSIVQELGRDKSKVPYYLEMSRIAESVPFFTLLGQPSVNGRNKIIAFTKLGKCQCFVPILAISPKLANCSYLL